MPHRHLVLTIPRLIRNTFKFDRALLGELWRHTVLRRLRDAGALAGWQIAKLQNWRHSGFSLDAGEAPLAAGDAAGRRRLAEYLLRAPFSLEKITDNAESGSALYRSERHWQTRRNFEVFSAHKFIAALLSHLPAKGSPQVRYYGWYSNRRRGLRQRTAGAAAGKIHAPPARPRRRRRARRESIQQVWGAAPLRCPHCSGLLRSIAVVETRIEILAILTPLGLARPHERPFAHGSPQPESDVLIDAASGAAHPLASPAWPPGLPYPQPRHEAIRFRAEVMAPNEDFDQTGFELPLAPPDAPADPGQGKLFGDDCSLPDAADRKPVFWTDGAGQSTPDDDFVQADAAESV